MSPARLEDGLTVSGQIDLEDIDRLAGNGTRRIVNVRPDGEVPGQLSAAVAARAAAEHGVQYIHLPVTMRGLSMDAIRAFGSAIEDERPVHAHCGSGLRAATLWGLHQVVSGRMSRDDALRRVAASGYDLKPGLAWLDSQPGRISV